jgi:hypothetical protein
MKRRWQRGCLIFVTIGLVTTLGLCTLLPLGLGAIPYGLIPRRATLLQVGPIWIGDPCLLMNQVRGKIGCRTHWVALEIQPFGEIWASPVRGPP